MTLLLDADLIVMRFACKNETNWNFPTDNPDDPEFISSDPEAAKQETEEFLSELKEKLRPDRMILCFTGKDNWRKQVFPTYKHNRAGRYIPKLRDILTEYLMKHHQSLRVSQLEADDLLGILQTYKNATGEPSMIASIDKDLRQIPGWHYNWNKDENPVLVEERDGAWFHMFQTLTGDSTDGYSGCPGIGPKKAEAILPEDVLADPLETWSRIVTAYEQAGQGEAEAIANARMARILRCDEYEHEPRRVKLWLPFGQEEWREL